MLVRLANFAKPDMMPTMPTTMNISLSDELKSFVDERVKSRGYSTHSEYVRDLVRRDEQEAGRERLRALMAEGLASGPGPGWATQREQLRQCARGTAGGQA